MIMLGLERCLCTDAHYNRLERPLWLRLFGRRELYRCLSCDTAMVLSQTEMETRLRASVHGMVRAGQIPVTRPLA